jgi:hypothetical protein
VRARLLAQEKEALIAATPGARERLAELAAIAQTTKARFLASQSLAELAFLFTDVET